MSTTTTTEDIMDLSDRQRAFIYKEEMDFALDEVASLRVELARQEEVSKELGQRLNACVERNVDYREWLGIPAAGDVVLRATTTPPHSRPSLCKAVSPRRNPTIRRRPYCTELRRIVKSGKKPQPPSRSCQRLLRVDPTPSHRMVTLEDYDLDSSSDSQASIILFE